MPGQPQQTPIVQKPSPVIADQLLIETADSNSGMFDRMLEYGHLHTDQTKYPGHRLLKQGPNAYGVYQRVWGTSPVLQDTYNAEKEFSADSNSHAGFVRSYRVLRSDYLVDDPATKLQPFTGIVAVKVTAAGTGYTKDFAVSFTGGGGSGAVGLAIVDGVGGVARVEIMAIGSGYTSAPTVVFSAGDGTGATGTAVIQPTTALLTIEKHSKLPEDDPYSSLFDRVVRFYENLPGPILYTQTQDEDTRGRVVVTSRQRGAAGTLDPESGNGVIGSQTQDLTTTVEERTSRKVASLPPDESWGYWDYVSIPTLVFSLTHSIYCNNSQFFTLVTNYNTGGGASFYRKHRVTVSYHNSAPNPDLSASAFEANDIRYQGKVISFAFSNVLNDALSYDGDFYNSDSESACFWTEAYDYAATTPSATAFAAGMWISKSLQVQPWGTTGFKSTLVEYYSAPGNPSI